MNSKTFKVLIICMLPLFSFSFINREKSNGKSIYTTGKNLQGKLVLDKSLSRIKFAHSCKTCHGAHGDRMDGVSIKFKDLSNPAKHSIPYNDSLFFRFLDNDLLSDGTTANIGVRWKMSDENKKDLLEYLKGL